MAVLRKTEASLRILGDDLDPEEITAALGKQPDKAARLGDTLRTPLGGERISQTGVWSVSVEQRIPGDLDAQIAKLLEGTTENIGVWRNITSRFKSDIFCGLFLDECNEGLSISPTTMKALGERGILLDLDIYSGTDEPEAD